jgi:hypothetical protein
VEGDDMLRLVAQGLGIGTVGASKAMLLEQVEERLEQEYRGGKRTLIVVDEAQNLPISALEELRMLSNFHLGGRALVQIVLLGQPEFRDKIAAPGLEQLRQRVIANHHLEAMGADEIEAYVRHRLRLVGWSGRPEFSADAYDSLFRFTGGVPRRLNQILNRLLLHGAIEGLDRLDAGAVEAVADDLEFERVPNDNAPVLPLRPRAGETAAEPVIAVPHEPKPRPVMQEVRPHQDRPEPHQPSGTSLADERIAALEARLEEQEATLRRVLTLLVDWAERDERDWDRQGERRSGTDRRFHAV